MVRTASSKIKGINIKIGADTTGLDTALKGIETSGKKATSELREVNSSLRNNNDSVVLWKQKQELLTTAIEESRKKLNFLNEAQEQIKRQFENREIDNGQYRAFQREIENTQREINNFTGQLEQANQRVEELGDGLEHSGQQAENSANGGYSVLGNVFANVITEGIKLAGNALKNFTQDVIATGEEYESAISNVVAISGAMAEEVEMLQEKAEEMGATTKFTASESAEAMSYMAMAGWKVSDMVSGLDGIMDLSAASGESLASVSDIVTDALTALGLQASDSAHFADVLAAASSNANTNVSLMGESFKYVAPIAGSMGASAEDLAIALGLMANSGIKASQAGTSLKNALVNLVKPTDAQISAMEELGLAYTKTTQVFDYDAIEKAQEKVTKKSRAYENAMAKHTDVVARYGEESVQFVTATNNLENALEELQKAQDELTTAQKGTTKEVLTGADAFTDEYGNMKSLREIIDVLRSSLGKIDVALVDSAGNAREYEEIIAELSQTEEGLVQSEQLKNAGILFGKQNLSGMLAIINATDADYKKLAEAVDNADGTAKDMAETMLDNLQGDKTLLESAVDGMKIAISKEINPALRELVQYATSQIPKIQAVVEPLFKGAVNGVKSLITGFEKMKPVLSGTAIAATGVCTALVMTKAVNFFDTKFIPILKSAGTAVKSLWGIISANPLAAGVIAVGALTAGLIAYKNAQLDVKSESELLIEKHNEELQLLVDKRQAISDLNDTFYKDVDGIETQTDRTKDLWAELDKLADQYGNIQQKDKARAEYILNELNEALGTEYKMTGNQIEGYKQLSAEIDNIIAKKQAEMMLDSYLANSNEMNKQRIEARSDYENANKDYQEKHKILEDARKEYEEVSGESWKNLTKEVDKTKAFNIIDADSFTYSDPEKYAEVAKKLWSADSEERQARILKNEAEKNYQATSEYFDKLDDLQEAYSLGQYDRMAEIIYAEKDLTSTTLDESATDAEQRLEIYSDNLQKIHSDFQLAVKDMRQKSVDELEKDFNNLMQSGMVAGVDPLKTLDELDFQQKVKDFQKKGLDISPLINSLVDTGVTPAEVFGSDWQEIFKTQLKNGGNMESMLKWLNNSDYTVSIPLVFGNNKDFIKYIKEQSAQGLDVSSLLELGAKSGLAESEEFVKIFKSQVSKNLEKDWDVGNLLEVGNKVGISCAEEFAESYGKQMQILKDNDIDLTTFIQWAEANGKTIAQVFGENFKNELSAYMKQKTKKTFNVLQESKNPFVDFFYTDDYLTNKLIKTFENGEDISKLVKQAEKQGLKVGDVFGDNYTDVIQQQIDKGYSIDELLEWGEISGGDTGNTLGKYYTSEVQKFVDNGFSVDSLLEWARNSGYKAGEVFGEKFREISEQYIELQEKTDYIRQEIADSGFYGNFFYGNKNLKFMADGGFLSNGQAVVAEAGPELLEIVNGGVRVTPLSENSRNTAVNSDGGQKVFYSNYTINATIASSYDVSRLAEELETERRRIERGAGR